MAQSSGEIADGQPFEIEYDYKITGTYEVVRRRSTGSRPSASVNSPRS